MTAKRFKYGSNERWECVLIDTLEKKEYDFCEVGKLCNKLWEQTQRFEKHNQDLMEENEQLKKENYELHKRLGDFEPFEEHIKERTSKTSLEDIIGIVKTDEPTNSVELKKELYK